MRPGIPVPEFLLEDILRAGFAALKTTPAVLDDLFALYPLAFRAEALAFITTYKIDVRQNWPLEALTQPTVCVVNSGTSEDASRDTLDNAMGAEDAADPGAVISRYGIAENCTYQLFLSTPDPRMTIILSILVRALLILNFTTLMQGGLHNPMISQSDLRFSEEMLPMFQNPRVVTLSALAYFTVPVTERIIVALVATLTPEV